MSQPATQESPAPRAEFAVSVDLTAVVVAVTDDQPRVLIVRPAEVSTGERLDALPSGPLELGHRTLESGLRAWVEAQARAKLGYIEQLYTFGDRDRTALKVPTGRILSIGYLALARETGAAAANTSWQDWYRYFPWEDWRRGRPSILDRLEPTLRAWVAAGPSRVEQTTRKTRISVAFGLDGARWSEERVLERYELLYEIGLAFEAHRDGSPTGCAQSDVPTEAQPMTADHRRILATGIARLRGKIKYRPVVFELMPPAFTLLQLQRTVEALAGLRLHKQNFRRLVAQQGLVEETGGIVTGTGGRPAREVRFRHEVLIERPAPGLRLPIAR